MSDQENIFTVSEVNQHLKNIIENMLGNLMIEGEISNYIKHNSGHIYFNLKDEYSTIKCVFFKTYNQYMKFSPKNGDKVVCAGKVTVYEPQGAYQIQVMNMYQAGIGKLQQQFEDLKKKLEVEGLFAREHKKKIPQMPNRIGVISSESGAAFQDVKNIISRRYPMHIMLYPATVQGENAAREVSEGIKYFNEQNNVDVILITRGGGSQEDLFCFNDEALAREIFKSKIPTVSAVGHEIDFTIADFVADLRAPTPSAGAELLVPNREELLNMLKQKEAQQKKLCLYKISQHKNMLQQMDKNLERFHPMKRILILQQRLDQYAMTLIQVPNYIQQKKTLIQQMQIMLNKFDPRRILFLQKEKLMNAENTLFGFKDKISQIKDALDTRRNKMQQMLQILYQQRLVRQYQKIENLKSEMPFLMQNKLNSFRLQLQKYNSVLNEFSPERALEKGYALIKKEQKFIYSAKQLKEKDILDINFKDGVCECEILSIKEQ
ncbi:MAG: exodeoxyribonuclease VII large subunit [Candidatus Cloacimonadales bacterium]|jgi:exodeoxyribonuclease VII large subunit|nr:exodeoxyribonuclease VII large subunit [Candidatus Cloacimonadota bacterium]MDX9977863.1 exodeoxyribonuclease VII large subunit [Candidatus Cloacimonadales bacterium]